MRFGGICKHWDYSSSYFCFRSAQRGSMVTKIQQNGAMEAKIQKNIRKLGQQFQSGKQID